jgi:hypothetical protein
VVIHYTVVRNCTEKGKKGKGIIKSEGKMRRRERREVGLKERNNLSG